MTEQELIQENEKLNARLQKAVVVFNEQKTTITRLTEERDAARADLQKAQETIASLESKVAEASESDTKFFEQIQEIEDLKSEKEGLRSIVDEKSRELDDLNVRLQSETAEKKAVQEAHNANLKTLKETQEKVRTIQSEFSHQLQTMEESFAQMCSEVL